MPMRNREKRNPAELQSAERSREAGLQAPDVAKFGANRCLPDWAQSLLLLLNYSATEARERDLVHLADLLMKAQQELVRASSSRKSAEYE